MKKWKKYAAIIGVIALLMIFCLPMYFALKGDFSQKQFMASLFTVLFVAVMCYVLLMLFKYLNKKKVQKPAWILDFFITFYLPGRSRLV